MSDRFELAVRGGTVVTDQSQFRADIGVTDGRFSEIAAPGQLPGEAATDYDAEGLFVLPGVIDGHVHFREPGYEYKEDWTTGSTAAVLGGVTTVLDMPQVIPPTSSVESAQIKKEAAESKSYCDFGFFAVVLDENADQIAAMAESGLVVGFKAFLGETIGNLPTPNDGTLVEAFQAVRRAGFRIGFHAENDAILQHRMHELQAAGRTDPLAHVESRPTLAEVESIQRMGLFASYTGAPVHIFHLSSRDGLRTIDEWRAKGVDFTCETGPHYCFLTSEDMKHIGSVLRMNPPVREPGHADALFDGLLSGSVDVIATDHSPHTDQEKRNANIWKAIPGFAGVETSVRLFLTHGVNAGRMSLSQLVSRTSLGPARTWNLYPRKGVIQVGSDADLTIVDLEREDVIEADRMHGKNNTTPWEGQATTGAPVATIVRGTLVARDGQLVGPPQGRIVQPAEARVPA